jgi:hypothetical protein
VGSWDPLEGGSWSASQRCLALIWAGGLPHNRTLHTFDERLAQAAWREGFAVLCQMSAR